MSNDGARAAFVEAFYEVVAPSVEDISVSIEVSCTYACPNTVSRVPLQRRPSTRAVLLLE